MSHIPGAVRVEPNSQPDLRELGITTEDTGEREGFDLCERDMTSNLPLHNSGVLLLSRIPFLRHGSETLPSGTDSRPWLPGRVQHGGRHLPVGHRGERYCGQ